MSRSQSTLLVDTPRLNDGEADKTEAELTRRALLTKISLLGSAAIGAVVGIPIIGDLLGPLLKPTPSDWRNVGKVDDFSPGETKGGWRLMTPRRCRGRADGAAGGYIRREGQNDQFIAFAVNCTHLGCPVNWQPSSAIFICPCHGGVYYADGTVAVVRRRACYLHTRPASSVDRSSYVPRRCRRRDDQHGGAVGTGAG